MCQGFPVLQTFASLLMCARPVIQRRGWESSDDSALVEGLGNGQLAAYLAGLSDSNGLAQSPTAGSGPPGGLPPWLWSAQLCGTGTGVPQGDAAQDSERVDPAFLTTGVSGLAHLVIHTKLMLFLKRESMTLALLMASWHVLQSKQS
jgi:hypothetical protein